MLFVEELIFKFEAEKKLAAISTLFLRQCFSSAAAWRVFSALP